MLMDRLNQEAQKKEQRISRINQISRRFENEWAGLQEHALIRWWLKVRKLLGRSTPRALCEHRVSLPVFGSNQFLNGFLYNFPRYLNAIHESNGSGYFAPLDIKVGIITDEFMFDIYKDAFSCVYIPRANYRKVIDEQDISCLLYITGWRGRECPEYPMGDYRGDEGHRAAADALTYARSRGIKTIFQSIEDPPNYAVFLPIAKGCDYIFTSAEEMIPQYKRDTGNPHVFLLEYSVNPLMHNPIGFLRKNDISPNFMKRGVFFAGSYMGKYPERCAAMEKIFDGIIEGSDHRLFIADRNYGLNLGELYDYPEQYRDYLMPSIPHDDLQKAHKLFDYSVNLNSVTTSPTMCAMRTYEVQALGGLMLSNYSLAVSNQFPEIPIVLEPSEVGRILGGHTPGEVLNMQLDGIRRMFGGCTVYDRLNRMFSLCGIPASFPDRPVYVLCEDPAALAGPLAAQSLAGAEAVALSEAPARLAGSDGFAVVWDGSGSNPHFLQDLVNAFKFVDVDYVRYAGEGEAGYDYVEGEPPAEGALFNLSRVPVAEVASGSAAGRREGFALAEPAPPRPVSPGPKDLAVIVPVHDNGRYLEGRCFRSLLRSSAFDRMRVYLVDDGSTDPGTLAAVERLAASYPNVVAHFFGDGGSGSASRPRNKGLEMCAEPYVTFLDPDNEAINDGYARLLGEVRRGGCDFAMGTVLMVDGTGGEAFPLRFCGSDAAFDDPRAALVESSFKAQSMQACVFDSAFLRRSGISLVEGGVGQDTLFSYEVMAAARCMVHLDLPIHVYYAERSGSAVNAVGVRFFEKSLLVERAQAAFLEREGLMGEYMARRYGQFMRDWYMAKLAQVAPADAPRAAEVVGEIAALYE
ncbi:hypothetical protein C811_00155 [Adlercreutzia caecimuris B7]|uniref:Glycosyltransferase 2-like domain-containing protein n=4 Tax=Adlercreutzia caecimuris TaxID=671266 RepID=R9LAV8_9ACTN|nr:hypothetical protein C811_00155 [Adlercreutzia caecimuris B7]